jgi:hypothetical protein
VQGTFGFDDSIFTNETNCHERTKKKKKKRGSLHGNGTAQNFGIDASVLISWEAMK